MSQEPQGIPGGRELKAGIGATLRRAWRKRQHKCGFTESPRILIALFVGGHKAVQRHRE